LVNGRNEVELQDETGRLVARYYSGKDQRPSDFSALAFSPDGRLLAMGNTGEVEDRKPAPDSVQLWDVHARKFVRSLRPDKRSPDQILFSPDGRVLATADRGQRIQLFDVARGRELARLKGHEDAEAVFVPMAFSPDGALLAAGGRGDGIVIWEAASG